MTGLVSVCVQVLQLYQITQLHHGLMMVGPSGSGKSCAWRVLLKVGTVGEPRRRDCPRVEALRTAWVQNAHYSGMSPAVRASRFVWQTRHQITLGAVSLTWLHCADCR